MKWLLKEPTLGDMIRVRNGSFYHYGIYVSDGEVIQFGLAPSERAMIPDSEIEVLSSDIDAFLAGGFLEVAEFDKKEKKKNRPAQEVVEFARGRLGMRGYSILYNNCEHFATECVTGVRSCEQADSVRALFRSMAVVDVYIAKIPEGLPISTVIPKQRDEEIRAVSNERVRREKYFVWRLLEYAIERSLGLKMKKIKISKSESGKWRSPSCEFSLSHSEGAVAVAVSRAPVGVDIEAISVRTSERLPERVLTEEELVEYRALSDDMKKEYFISAWTAKEAAFKRSSAVAFEPQKTYGKAAEQKSFSVELDGEKYILAVSTANPEKIKLYESVDLEKYLR